VILDLFAGPGGWDEGLASLGLAAPDVLGLELDTDCYRTRRAAGHWTLAADVAAMDPTMFSDVDGLIASPPCPDFSVAGQRAGIDGDSGRLMWEVPRWVDALRPRWVACEQVPPALEWYEDFARRFQTWGYKTWTGVLNAADHGVPQTRQRAFLMASLDHQPHPPEPTHAADPQPSLSVPPLERWVSMADALGWMDDPTVNTRGNRTTPGGNEFSGTRPSWELTEKARSWTVHTNRDQRPDGSRQTRDALEPAPTLTGKSGGQWTFDRGDSTRPLGADDPAPTVAADPRITARCHHDEGSQGANAKTTEQVRAGDYEGTEPIWLTIPDALILQGFRPDYPLAGTQTSRFRQCGNAVPPPLAAAVLSELVGAR